MTGTVNFATEQGLGIQTRSFIQHGVVDKILLREHSTYQNHPEWYPTQSVRDEEELLSSCDRLMFMQGFASIVPEARRRGIKTILITHYEFTGKVDENGPDVLVAPSGEDLKHYPSAVRINIPVEYPWTLRRRAEVFVHNAGHGGVLGRNGTATLISAMQYVKSPIKLIIRVQPDAHPGTLIPTRDPRVEIRVGSTPYEELFTEGDVFILPDKFGGSFLPMQEAFAAGMPVMASARSNNYWLPQELLIPVARYVDTVVAGQYYDSALILPEDIAESIDTIYGSDITEYSLMGKKWAEENSWEVLKEKYAAL